MKSRTMLRTGAMVLLALLAIAAQPSAWGQTFTSFDPSGSQLTAPGSINAAGQITGSYFDSTFAQHGFVRGNDGTISSFDVPGFLATIVITQHTQSSSTLPARSGEVLLTPAAMSSGSFALPVAISPCFQFRPHLFLRFSFRTSWH